MQNKKAKIQSRENSLPLECSSIISQCCPPIFLWSKIPSLLYQLPKATSPCFTDHLRGLIPTYMYVSYVRMFGEGHVITGSITAYCMYVHTVPTHTTLLSTVPYVDHECEECQQDQHKLMAGFCGRAAKLGGPSLVSPV